ALVLHVQDRHVRPVQQAFAAIVDKPEFYSRSIGRQSRPGSGRRAQYHKPPQDGLALADCDQSLARGVAYNSIGISQVAPRYSADGVLRLRCPRGPCVEPDNGPLRQVEAYDLVFHIRTRRQEPDRDRALESAVGQLLQQQRWHGRVRLKPAFPNVTAEFRMRRKSGGGLGKFLVGRQWLLGGLSDLHASAVSYVAGGLDSALLGVVIEYRL